MQMQAAHRGRGPGDWQAGGMVGRNMMNPRAGAYAARQRFPTTPPLPSEIGYVVPPPRNWQAGGDVAAPTPPGGHTPAGPAPSMAEWFASRGMSDALQDFMPQDPRQFQWAAQQEAMRKAAAEAARAQAAAVRTGTQAQRQASRGPGGWQEGGVVDYASNFAAPWHRDADPSEALMAERDSLQQQLQTADEVTAQEILMRIMEITKELEMGAQNFGMADGGIASLMGGGRPVDTRYAAYEARKRNRPPPPPPPQIQIGRALTPMGLNPSGSPYDPANQPVVARPIGPGGG